jgi:hypothetical protein
MHDEIRTCESCGKEFNVPGRLLEAMAKDIAPGKHHPKDCPEGLDQMCPSCEPDVYGPSECPSCRPKQDQQRS